MVRTNHQSNLSDKFVNKIKKYGYENRYGENQSLIKYREILWYLPICDTHIYKCDNIFVVKMVMLSRIVCNLILIIVITKCTTILQLFEQIVLIVVILFNFM